MIAQAPHRDGDGVRGHDGAKAVACTPARIYCEPGQVSGKPLGGGKEETNLGDFKFP